MTASLRSRLAASYTAALAGLVVASWGIAAIPRPDLWIWLTVASVLLLTAAAGVLLVDRLPRVSVWAVLGVQLILVFVSVPLMWVLHLAVLPPGAEAQLLVPSGASGRHFVDLLSRDTFQHDASVGLVVAAVSTLIAIVAAAFAAYALVNLPFRGRRVVYGAALICQVVPTAAVAGPWGDQLRALGAFDSLIGVIIGSLVITVPLAVWLLATYFRHLPWALADAARADGATGRQVLLRVLVPVAGPGVLTATAVVFVVAWNDLVVGSFTSSGRSTPMPASLRFFAQDYDNPVSATAAAGLLWAVPPLILIALAGRGIFAGFASRKV